MRVNLSTASHAVQHYKLSVAAGRVELAGVIAATRRLLNTTVT